ncbi:alpha/beta hydrolase [Paenibacillus sp. LHD-117]|uniref:alpha/beta fold hydrolase n=1 Tax=Paenibacillus sp. LHD-117 TaxID=3071412 RepID=UPI0027DF66DA|nr:alpha/beta hydrolase [Paenibacillus sp. LHD-117]MDQ6418018.1 alpha/beta hydrolase [Paenibacillus sp. LHD-117]
MYVEVEKDVHIYVEDINPGPGSQTVFFIHGWPLSHAMFEYQYNVLPMHGYRCIAMDMRGFGQSDKPWHGYTYDRLADDAAAVISALQVQDATLVGFSMGGAVSIRYMARHKAKGIKKLVLIDAVAPALIQGPDAPDALPQAAFDALLKPLLTNRPKFFNDVSLMFFNRNLGPAMQQWFVGMGMQSASYASINLLLGSTQDNVSKDLAAIKVPTAIFHGIHDELIPFKSAQLVHEKIHGSELIPMANSGHGAPICESEAFNVKLLEVLKR